MTKEIFLISDTHFQHTNILEFGPRPFSSIQEHDEALIENWNSVVKPGDKVYHLGDVCFGSRREGQHLVRRLRGKKTLILGNHDNARDPVCDLFNNIVIWRALKDFGLLLTHIPVHESTLYQRHKDPVDFINVHGHIHNEDSPSEKHINISCERIGYTPVNIEQLRVK